jgi:hypothetical protein
MLNCHTYELNCYICKYKDGDEMNVNGLLQQNFNETLVNRSQVWELDEENIQAITFKGLSEAGAREIWLASGYLKEI